jgi:hypothetical protein
MDELTLDIPLKTTTQFLIPTSHPLAWPAEHIAPQLDRLADSPDHRNLATAALGLLDSADLTIEMVAAARSTWREELADVAAPDHSLYARLAAPFHHIAEVSAPTAAQPQAAQESRLIARLLADGCGGVVADLAARAVLPPNPEEPPQWHVGDGWITIFQTMDDPASHDLRVETGGLNRFGLPELCTRKVGLDVQLTATNLLRGMATKLIHGLREHLAGPGPSADTTWTIPARQHLESAWVSHYYRQPPIHAGALSVVLEPMPDSPNADLEVLPPKLIRADTGRWWRKYAALTIPDLIDYPPFDS